MIFFPRTLRFRLTDQVYYSYYFVGLQNNFVLGLQSGETLGFTVRL
jgi:hypothetical protein